MPRLIDHSPSPKSHIKTLMRIGYTLNSAVADIIDNSITAGAKNIEVYAPPGMDEPTISILDDGCGMDLDDLTENMRIGCKDPEEERQEGDLGRFGSGMKTASFSQARQLTVVTRKQGSALVAARWDIDKIEESDSWCLEVFRQDEIDEINGLAENFPSESGTQIIWSKLTVLEKGNHALDHDLELAHRLAELKSYLALHFHRFMVGFNKRLFSLNNTIIEHVDPFMTREKGYQEGPSEKLRCKGGHIVIQTHVLPHFKNMSPERLEELGGADGISQGQGLYIYREKRLISAGGWLGLARNSQLGALARVQVDIPSSLDNDWSTDVKKASLQIPPRVKRSLKKFLADPIKRSRKVHRYRGKQDVANNFWRVCEDENTNTITYQIDSDNELLSSLVQRCGNDERRMLVNYLKQLAVNLPINHIYEKMAERPRDVSQESVNLDALEEMLNRIFED
ncbi:MAG: ATP-binding protein [Candidatus Brocadiales bacterium]|nr:ATP-binding protein [Candidatus Brocadiales bacterium]